MVAIKGNVRPTHRSARRHCQHTVRCTACGWKGQRRFESDAPCPRCGNPELDGMRRPSAPVLLEARS